MVQIGTRLERWARGAARRHGPGWWPPMRGRARATSRRRSGWPARRARRCRMRSAPSRPRSSWTGCPAPPRRCGGATSRPEQAKEVAARRRPTRRPRARLLDQAEKGSLDELRNEASGYARRRGPRSEATHRRIHRARHARSRTDADGTWSLTLRGTPASGARIMAGLNHRADCDLPRGPAAGRREPAEAYLFDAAEELCRIRAPRPRPPRARATDPTPGLTPKRPGAESARRCRRARTRRSSLGSTGLRSCAAGSETARCARSPASGRCPCRSCGSCAEDAFLAAVLTKGTDICSVTHLGRRHTALQVTALQWRDPECARLGCTNTVRLEYEHREDWADTHVTKVDASERLCHDDHNLKTEQGWMLVEGTGKRRMVPPDHPDHPLQVAVRRPRTRRQPVMPAPLERPPRLGSAGEARA